MTATTLSNLSIPVGKQSRISVIVTKNIPKTSSTNIGTLNELFDFLLNSLCHANSTCRTGLGAGCILAQQTTAGLFVDIHSPIHSFIVLMLNHCVVINLVSLSEAELLVACPLGIEV